VLLHPGVFLGTGKFVWEVTGVGVQLGGPKGVMISHLGGGE